MMQPRTVNSLRAEVVPSVVRLSQTQPRKCIQCKSINVGPITGSIPTRRGLRQQGRGRQEPKRLLPASLGSENGTVVTAANDNRNDALDSTMIVQKLLDIVGTEGRDKSNMTDDSKAQAEALIGELEQMGANSRPLENELVFGNYNVAYVSQGSKQAGQPAGGRFRTGFGRLLFQTLGLYQSILKPNIAVNKVNLKILGFIPCSVGLRGTFMSIPEKQGGEDNADTVKVFFDKAVISLPFGIHTRIGPTSSVVLKTTYVDENVRIGKGSRGSLFVFSRGGESDNVDMEHVGLQESSFIGKLLIFAFCTSMIAGGIAICKRWFSIAPLAGLGIGLSVAGAALLFIFSRGGVLDDKPDRPEITMA